MDRLTGRIERHLASLAGGIGPRPAGSAAAREATTLAAEVLQGAGWRVARHPFTTRDWSPGSAEVVPPDGPAIPVEAPFSRPCDVTGRIVRLESSPGGPCEPLDAGRIVVLAGDLTRAPIFPKAYPFVNDPEQQALVGWLEAARPAAVLAVAQPDGAPGPLLEDGDLGMPYATVPAAAGETLTTGVTVRVRIAGELRNGDGATVSATADGEPGSAVIAAHIDTKATTPGWLDNGASVAGVLALAEEGPLPGVELVLFCGEDHYAAPGEVAWLGDREIARVRLMVNLDGVGLAGYPTGAVGFSLPDELQRVLTETVAADEDLVTSEPWLESDHAIFAMAGIPTVALTSGAPHTFLMAIAHDPADERSRIDVERVADAVDLVRTLLRVAAPTPIVTAH